MSYCHSAPSVVRPSVRPSVVRRPSSVRRKLSHFRLLLWNHWTEFNKTWQKARSQRPLPSLCFSGRSEKQDGRPGLWLAETFSTSPLKPLNGIQRNLTGSKISTPSTKFVFFGPIWKIRWPPWPLIGWDIFDFSSVTAERNSTKLDRKQDLNALYQVCVFRADRKNKMAALASDLLRHFRLLLWNRWTEFNETWQEARDQSPLPSLCFSGRSEKQDGRPGLWLAETFSTSPLKPLNRIQQNLIGGKISTPSTKFVFFGPITKTRWPPPASDWLRHFRLLCRNRWTEFKESWQEARSQRPLPSLCFLDRSEKQDGRLASDWLRYFRLLLWNRWMEFNETWQESTSKSPQPSLCFSGRSENKMAALAYDWLRHFRLILWNSWTDFSETWKKASSQCLLPRLCFSGKLGKNKMAALASDWLRHFRLLLWNCERNSMKLDRKQDSNALYQVCVFQVDRKNKMAALADDWLRHFSLLLWNTERNSTKLDRKQVLTVLCQVLCFSGLSKKTIWPPWHFWLFALRCFGHICPGADPGQGKNRSGGPHLKKIVF